jgi:hypothetical protein
MLKKLSVSMAISLTVATAYVLLKGTPPTPTVEIEPNTIEANKPAVVTFTVRLQDPAFKARSVDLIRVDANAHVLSDVVMLDEDGTNAEVVPGHQFFMVMKDDGTKGDRIANDSVFTRRVMLNEPNGPIYFEVDAAFARASRPVRSAPFAVNVKR